MSVQTEINRISGNVADALAALAEKGVTVPAGAKSDNLAELIAAIEAGGGGRKVTTGTFTPTSAAVQVITHGLGEVPSVFHIYYQGSSTGFGAYLIGATSALGSKGVYLDHNGNTTGYTIYQYAAYAEMTKTSDPISSSMNYVLYKANAQTISVGSKVKPYLAPSKTYNWIAIGS